MEGNILSNNGQLTADEALQAAGGGIPAAYGAKEPFIADGWDTIFAVLAFVLGFFFVRWVMFSWQGWGVTVFTFGYCIAVTMYFIKKGVAITPSGFFWLAAVVLIGISYSLYLNNGLELWRSLFL
nr:hypothetical protein [Bacillota bacterium]